MAGSSTGFVGSGPDPGGAGGRPFWAFCLPLGYAAVVPRKWWVGFVGLTSPGREAARLAGLEWAATGAAEGDMGGAYSSGPMGDKGISGMGDADIARICMGKGGYGQGFQSDLAVRLPVLGTRSESSPLMHGTIVQRLQEAF